MALSKKTKDALAIALTDAPSAKELVDAIESASNSQAAAVTPLAITISDPPTDVEVQAVADKVDALIQALKDAGLMA